MLNFCAGLRRALSTTIRQYSTGINGSRRAAVILSGTGVYDGSELHEASAILVHLSRHKAAVTMFAPDIRQMHVINHITGDEMKEDRNVLVESARIARGSIEKLASLSVNNFDCIIFPGGFGAAKNLSTFAIENSKCTVNEAVIRVIQDFHRARKPIALCCISPVLASKVLGAVELTVGGEEEENGKWPYSGTVAAIRDMGSTHVKRDVSEIHVDERNLIVTTPAFMANAPLYEIFDGIGNMITATLSLVK